MEENKVSMMLEHETEDIAEISKRITEAIKCELDRGIENVDTKELGEAVDMLKDLYEAKEKLVKAHYYKFIMEKMEEEPEDEEEESERRYYRGQPRDSMGRFRSRRGGRRGYEEPMYHMSPEMYRENEPEYYRDMDRKQGRMYYAGGGSSGGMTGGSGSYREDGDKGHDRREGRSGQSRRSYMETKEMNKGNSPEEKQQKMKELENYMKELSTDITEMIADSTNEEKTLLKSKLQTMLQKIQ